MKRLLLVVAAMLMGGVAAGRREAHAHAQTKPTALPVAEYDWRAYGGHVTADHYSPLAQINRSNVKDLQLAWKFDTGEASGGMQTNPLIVGRVLYAYTASQKVIALDATDGHLLWKFDSGVGGQQPARGLAYWTDRHENRLLAGIMNYLYAIEPSTGRPIPSFGEGGRIDLRKGLGGDFERQSIVLTSPGVVYKDVIIVGGRNPETPPAPPGDIRAFDVRTGVLRWRFRTIPHPGEDGYESWPKDAWKTAGAANSWGGMSLDERRGIVYVPTGSAVPDFFGGERLGNDLFADTLLALDAATGKMIWHFQGVHHDIWDRDFPTAPLLMTIRRNGRDVDVVAQTSKQGFLFVLDRVTGKPIFPIEERPVAASTVPGEVSSPTQPFPTLPEPYALQALSESDLTERTPEAHARALNEFRSFRNGGQFTPLSVGVQTVVAPGFDGGAEWGGPGADLATGVLYVNANNIVNTGGLDANVASAGLGKRTYASQCALCHRENRAGSPPDFPSLVDVNRRLTTAQITETIHRGKGRMPAFPGIEEERLKALLEYVRTGKDNSVAVEAKEMQHTSVAQPERAGGPADPAGAVVYAEQCAICHGDRREGIAPSFPSLVGVQQRLTAHQIAEVVHTGRGRMPAFSQSRLPEAELQALLRYLGASDVLATNDVEDEVAVRYNFTGYRKFYDSDGYPANKPPWGTLNAIDVNTGRYLWRVPLGEYPELKSQGLPITGSENYGGPVVTAGGLVFIGATVFDHKLRVFDSRTGALLWEAVLPVAGLATPATYMVDGKQYVVIAAGGGKDPKMPKAGYYLAFALP
jgi:glucose dehydrogenase